MNTTQLHRDDAKFYSVILSFSEDEIKSMGGSRDEILASVHDVVERTMDHVVLLGALVHCVHYAITSELFKRRLGGRLVIPKGFSIGIILIVTGIKMCL